MTLGEKIKSARKNVGLSQEQLAQKLCVSRAAVAKWETDKGTPDIINLKALSRLLDVSVDSLLNDDFALVCHATRESIDWETIKISRKHRNKFDAAVVNRFPEADYIYRLTCIHDFNRIGRIMNIITFGLLASLWQLTHWKKYIGYCYWVENSNGQYFFLQAEENALFITVQNRRLLRSERSGGTIEIQGIYYRIGFNLLS